MKRIYEKLLEQVPDYQAFLTLEELEASSRALAEQHPDCVELFEFGRTTKGRPLNCLKIGSGSHNALLFGCPHPNEPIGTMMLEYLTRSLAENEELRRELDYTFYVVKAWDADGLTLNEKWLKGPYTLYQYSRNFFRPAGHKQVDWTFPIDYKELHFHDTIPETAAMMKLIDQVKPSFLYALHNAGFGGVYWYITRQTPELYDQLRQSAHKQGVPLNLGEPEAPYCVAWSPAIYQDLGIEQDYDYLERYGNCDMSTAIRNGTCSASYAKQVCGGFTLLTEMPYFYDERIKDERPSGMLRRDAVLQKLDWTEKAAKFLRDTLAISKPYLDPENPFMLAIESFTQGDSFEAARKMAQEDPAFNRIATVAEQFDNLCISKFYQMLSYGMLVRANESELEELDRAGVTGGEKRQALERAFALAEPAHRALAEELERDIHYQVVPIRKLVSIQLECGLLMAEYLKEHPHN